MKSWNEKLKCARLDKQLSQNAAAELIGITRACYANYEQGIREPSIATIKNICSVLDISADYLVGLIDEDC